MKELEQWINKQPSKMVAYRALADAADCRWQQIQKWLRLGYVPTRRVAAISRATGIKPSRLNAVVGALHQIEITGSNPRRSIQQPPPSALDAFLPDSAHGHRLWPMD